MPYIDKAVDDYYTKFLDQKPLVDPWDIKSNYQELPPNWQNIIKKNPL